MTRADWALLGFALWTLVLLTVTVGVHRWSRILTGRARIAQFSADGSDGPGWYRRAVRAHANCVENLPVFGALVLLLEQSGAHGPAADWLSAVVLPARIAQSLVHVGHEQTDGWVALRFTLYLVQAGAFFGLAVVIALHGR